jgi:hypothetical protein
VQNLRIQEIHFFSSSFHVKIRSVRGTFCLHHFDRSCCQSDDYEDYVLLGCDTVQYGTMYRLLRVLCYTHQGRTDTTLHLVWGFCASTQTRDFLSFQVRAVVFNKYRTWPRKKNRRPTTLSVMFLKSHGKCQFVIGHDHLFPHWPWFVVCRHSTVSHTPSLGNYLAGPRHHQHGHRQKKFGYVVLCILRLPNTVEPGYKDIDICDTSFIASDILWYQLILRC